MIEFLTFLLFVVTAAYVALTYELAKSAAESVRIARSQYILAKQPTVLMYPHVQAEIVRVVDDAGILLESLTVHFEVSGDHPALDLRQALRLSRPDLRWKEQSAHPFIQGASFWPSSSAMRHTYIFDPAPLITELWGPLTGELTLTYKDVFGTPWTSRWALRVGRPGEGGRLDLIDLTNPHLPPLPAVPPAP